MMLMCMIIGGCYNYLLKLGLQLLLYVLVIGPSGSNWKEIAWLGYMDIYQRGWHLFMLSFVSALSKQDLASAFSWWFDDETMLLFYRWNPFSNSTFWFPRQFLIVFGTLHVPQKST